MLQEAGLHVSRRCQCDVTASYHVLKWRPVAAGGAAFNRTWELAPDFRPKYSELLSVGLTSRGTDLRSLFKHCQQKALLNNM